MVLLQLFAGVLIIATGGVAQSPESDSASKLLLRLADDVVSPTGVERLAIFWVPKTIETHSALTADQLEKRPLCEIRIDLRLLPAEALGKALRRTHVESTTAVTDLRWGIVFWYRGGRREAVYLDGFGDVGQIGTTKVKFKSSALLEYLEGVGKGLGY